MQDVATMLANFGAERIVFNRTGLTGEFDFDLHWTNQPTSDSDEVGLMTAVEEQLGLRLSPITAPVQVIVIDHAEQPSEN
jgi:uncharacterized protein (TIGR03435 family)